MKRRKDDLAKQYQLAGAGGIEPPNGGIKISLIVQRFPGAFGKKAKKRLLVISIAWQSFPNAEALPPNGMDTWTWGGFNKIFLGNHQSALEYFHRAIRLSPTDPSKVDMVRLDRESARPQVVITFFSRLLSPPA